jgi:hypothetical protein
MAEEDQNEGTDIKKIIWISVLAGVGTLILGLAITFLVRNSQFTSYYDDYYKIHIKYPKSWAVFKDLGGTIVAFRASEDDALDNFRENLNISVSDLPPQGMALEQYSKIATGQAESVFQGSIEVIESQQIVFAGFPAYSYIMRAKQEPLLQLRFVWFFKDNRAYVITYAMQTLQYKKYIGKFNYMLGSFSIGEK